MMHAADTIDHLPPRNPNHVNQVQVLDASTAAARELIRGEHPGIIAFGGGPGTGKTATGLVLADRLRPLFPHARLYARLSGALDATGQEAQVLGDFLLALGVDPADIPDRLDARRALFQSRTAGKKVLVFLDGAVSASQVRTLLPSGGQSLVLVTEARPLGSLAAHGPVRFFDLAPLEDEAAIALFGRMLGEARVSAERTELEAIIGLCEQLPLALSVVGALLARFPQRSSARVLDELRSERRRVRLLSRDSDVSVDAAFTMSVSRLSRTAQSCYTGVGTAPGTGEWSVDALAAALELPAFDVEDGLRDLVDAKLAEELDTDRVVVRDLVRLHARQMDQSGDAEREARTRRLLRYYVDGAVAADELIAPARPWRDRFVTTGEPPTPHRDRAAAIHWMELERANLRAAVEYAYSVREYEWVCQLCVVLWPFYESGKYLDDLLATHQLGSDAAAHLESAELGSLIATQRGFAHNLRRNATDAVSDFSRAVGLAEQTGDPELTATATEGLGLALHAGDRFTEAREYLLRNEDLASRIGSARRIALARMHLAKVINPEAALEKLAWAESYFRGKADVERVNLAKVWTWQGIRQLENGDAVAAAEALDRALSVMVREKRRFDEAVILQALGDLARHTGDRATAG